MPTDQIDVSLGGQMIVSKICFRNNGCSSVVVKVKTVDDGWKFAKRFKFSLLKKNAHLFHTIVSQRRFSFSFSFQEFSSPVNALSIRFLTRSFHLSETANVSNIKIYRKLAIPKTSLIDLFEMRSEIDLVKNWKSIEKLFACKQVYSKAIEDGQTLK